MTLNLRGDLRFFNTCEDRRIYDMSGQVSYNESVLPTLDNYGSTSVLRLTFVT